MKQIKYIIILAVAAMFVGCVNPYPHEQFTNKNAFVAFELSASSDNNFFATENKTTEFRLPIYVASENGMETEVTVGVVSEDTDAVENVHYVLKTKNFSFTTDHRVDTLCIDILPNSVYYGKKTLTVDILNISNPDLKKLTPSAITLTIVDDTPRPE